MVEAAYISPILRTVCDGVMLWLRMGVEKKRVRLLRCLDVPIIIMKHVYYNNNNNNIIIIIIIIDLIKSSY